MKICILTRSLNTRTGGGELVDNLIRETQSLSPDSIFTTLTNDDVLKPDLISIIKNWGRIRREIRESDIVHAVDAYPYGVIAALANLLIGRPLIITAVGTGSLQLFSRFSFKSGLFRWAYRQADAVTAISRYVADEIKKHFKGINVKVINPGIDNDYWSFVCATSLDEELKTLEPYVLSVGELKKRKGYDVMLPIVAKLFKLDPSAHYVIVANTKINLKHRDEIYQKIKELGIEKKVTILSNLSRDELRNVFQHAYLYFSMPQAINGDIEGFGMSILQASSAGAPAIVGKGSGADDAVADQSGGLLVSQEDPDQILEKIHQIFSDKALRDKLAQGARTFTLGMSWRDQTKNYLEVYRSLKR